MCSWSKTRAFSHVSLVNAGILIYEMRSGHAPFYDPSQMEMYKKIVEGKLQFPAHFKQEEVWAGAGCRLYQYRPLGVAHGSDFLAMHLINCLL